MVKDIVMVKYFKRVFGLLNFLLRFVIKLQMKYDI